MKVIQKGKLFFSTFFIVLTLPVSGQIEKVNVKTRSADYEIDRGLEYFDGSSVYLSARFDKFLNTNYSNNLKNKNIDHSIGFELSYSQMLFHPVELEITGFDSMFKIMDFTKDGTESSIRHGGLEIFAKAYVLPYIGKISEYVAPFVGIGYQLSNLTDTKEDINANTSSFMYKAGTRVRLGKLFFIQAEYKQTFPKKDERLFRAFSVGLGVNYKLF